MVHSLDYYITVFSVCQVLFLKKLNLFFAGVFGRVDASISVNRPYGWCATERFVQTNSPKAPSARELPRLGEAEGVSVSRPWQPIITSAGSLRLLLSKIHLPLGGRLGNLKSYEARFAHRYELARQAL